MVKTSIMETSYFNLKKDIVAQIEAGELCAILKGHPLSQKVAGVLLKVDPNLGQQIR